MAHDSIEAVMEQLEYVLDDFDKIPRAAHATYRTYLPAHLIEHSLRAQATCIYDHMAAEAERLFDGRGDVRMFDLRGLKVWVFGEHTMVRFKKMDEDGKSRNYPTKQARAYDRMQQLEGLPPEPIRVSVGYLLDKTATKIERVQVSRPNARHVDWCAAIVPIEERSGDMRMWQDVTRQMRAFG